MDNQSQQPPVPITPADPSTNPVPPKPPAGKLGKIVLLFLLPFVVLFVIFFLVNVYLGFTEKDRNPQVSTNEPRISLNPSPSSSSVPPGWKTYNNRLHGFTMNYPADYRVFCDFCGSNQADAEWASKVEFIPPVSKGYGTITFITPSNEFARKPSETAEQYVTRRNNHFASLSPGDTASFSVVKQLKINNTDAVQTLHTYKPGHPPYIIRTEFFFKDQPVDIHFNDSHQTEYTDMRLPQAINTYPNFTDYERMIATFQTADLPQTITIDDRYLPSPDKSYYVRKQKTLGEPTTIVDKNGTVIVFDVFRSNNETIQTFQTNCHECSGEVGTWVDNTTLTLKLVGVSADNFKSIEYEYRVDASTGLVDPKSFRQTK